MLIGQHYGQMHYGLMQRLRLEQNLYYGLEEEGKIISQSSMQKVVGILAKFLAQFDNLSQGGPWWRQGFCVLYLIAANLDADLTDLLEIRKVDEEVGWFIGRDKLESFIFGFKAVNIILDEEVKKIFFFYFSKIKLSKLFVLGLDRMVQL